MQPDADPAAVPRTPVRPAARLLDGALALVLAAVSASILASLDPDRWRLVAGLALAVAHVAPLAVRRTHPVGVVVWMAGTAIAFVAVGLPVVALGPAALVAMYTVASRRPRPVSLRALAVASVAMALTAAASGHRWDTVVGNLVVFAAVWFVGDISRRAWERAVELARTREELARRAVVEERLRIARELHDIVAHALSVIAVQSGTGRMVVAQSPHLAAEALGAIEETSRTALSDMRRLLDVLRADDDDDDDGGGRSPSPGLAQLDDLVAVTAASGLAVDVRVPGQRRPLPAGVDAAAYRIVQEALTNVRKHARAERVLVCVEYRPCEVVIEVADDGCGPAPGAPAGGHGLLGMRERAALYGGTVESGRRPGGGYRVRATIPDRATEGGVP